MFAGIVRPLACDNVDESWSSSRVMLVRVLTCLLRVETGGRIYAGRLKWPRFMKLLSEASDDRSLAE